MIRPLVAVAVVAASSSLLFGAPASADEWYDGPCTDNVGVTVVIDFQELGGGVNVRCAPGPVTSGLDALVRAGIAWEPPLREPGFVCRIAGQPGPDREACGVTPPPTAYWGYWIAPRGGAWCYSNTGAGNRVPPPGSVEGWSFALDKSSSQLPPPGFAPPAAIPGTTPNPLSPADCSTAAGPTTSTTVAATTTTTTTSAATTTAAPTTVATTTQAPAQPVPPAGGAAGPTTTTSTSPPGTPTTSTTKPPAGTTNPTASTTSTTSTTTTTTVSTTTTTTPASTAPPSSSTAPLGTVDLGDDGRGEGGFGFGTAAGMAAAGALAATSFVVVRRRARLG